MTAVPVRTCVGCRVRSGADLMVRVARRADGSLCIDRVAPGRGAWLCREDSSDSPKQGCFNRALRSGAFARAFRAPVSSLRDTEGEHERMDGASDGSVEETKGTK